MKIINTVLGDATGGRWKIFEVYSHLLSQAGHEVLNVIQSKAVCDPGLFQGKGESLRRIRNSGHYDPLATVNAWRMIRAFIPDAIIAHSSRAVYLFQHASNRSLPVIAVNHSTNIKRSVRADYFFCISKEIEDRVQELIHDPTRSFRIHNPVDPVALQSIDAKSSAEKIRRSLPPGPVFGFLGRLVKDKGIDLFLNSFRQLTEQRLEISAVIAGDGEEMGAVRQFIEDHGLDQRIRLTGWLADPSVFYHSIDYLVFPSQREASPLTPVEASLLQVPVLASSLPGITETFKHMKSALLFDSNRQDQIMAQMAFAVSNPKLMSALAGEAKRVCAIKHSPDTITRGITEALKQITGQVS